MAFSYSIREHVQYELDDPTLQLDYAAAAMQRSVSTEDLRTLSQNAAYSFFV